jgi:hypothetical protein
MLAARAALDFASLLCGGAPPGRYGGIFAEAALLGWKDIPLIAPDRAGRTVWTMGARLPTFGWLDICTLQGEWHSTSAGTAGEGIGAGPPAEAPRRPSPWRFGLLLSKRIGAGFTAQARLLTYEEANPGMTFLDEPGGGAPRRRSAGLARIVFRLP